MKNKTVGDLEVVGSIAQSSNLLGINTRPIAGNDMGIIMSRAYSDITDYQYEGQIISSTSSSATLDTNIAQIGWIIELMNGSGVGQKLRISAVSGAVVNVAWTIPPSSGDQFRLYANSNIAFVYKPNTNRIYFGGTSDDYRSTNININPVPLVTSLDISSLSPVGASGTVLSSDGTTLSWQPAGGSSGGGRSATFSVVNNIYINTSSYVTCGYFAWDASQYASLIDGQLILYLETTAAVDIQLYDEISMITYCTASYSSTGYYNMDIVQPTQDAIISLRVHTVEGAEAYLRSAVIKFGSITESVGFTSKTIYSSYTILSSDEYILCAASSAITLTLPSVFKKRYTIIDISGTASSNPITIVGTINGASITTNYGHVSIISAGSSWYRYV